nr:enoyl-CoA hydratase/isomerase family protein [candidate division Zixibacteria bacterium]
MTEYKNIIVRKDAGCLWVTINRERALNALNRETIDELQQLFSFYWTDDEVRVVVVTGTGEKAFVAGADITELAETDLRTGTDYSARGL